MPLQGGQLAVQELQAALESGELIPAQSRSCSSSAIAHLPVTSFRETAQTAQDAIGVVGKLLDDFLSIAKIEEGRMVRTQATHWRNSR